MSDDKIKKIRTWHVHYPPSRNAAPSLIAAYQDIATLLAEVDRQRAEIERLRTEIDGLEAELALMKSGFEVAYRAMGDKP